MVRHIRSRSEIDGNFCRNLGAFDYRSRYLFQITSGRQIIVEIFIFIVGLCVSIMVVFGVFSLVPGQIRPPDEVVYRKDGEIIG